VDLEAVEQEVSGSSQRDDCFPKTAIKEDGSCVVSLDIGDAVFLVGMKVT
jgi:hypothetical protein